MGLNAIRTRTNHLSHSATKDSTHILIETEDDLLKPINVNWTSPSLKNPFVVAHNEAVFARLHNGSLNPGTGESIPGATLDEIV